MRPLPEGPNLEQFRRQAKELHRAARAGQPAAVRRVRAVSKVITLSAAQLALARDYSFSNWARLGAVVEGRRAGRQSTSPPA